MPSFVLLFLFYMEMVFLKTYSEPLNGFANPQKADMELRSTNSAVSSMIRISSLARTIMGSRSAPPKTNLREAAKWYEKAEEQGEEWAAYRLAHMYRNVSPRSPEKAEFWERKGNELRHGDAFRSHSRRNASDVFSRMLGGGVLALHRQFDGD